MLDLLGRGPRHRPQQQRQRGHWLHEVRAPEVHQVRHVNVDKTVTLFLIQFILFIFYLDME